MTTQYPLSVEQPGTYGVPGLPFPVMAQAAGGPVAGPGARSFVWRPGGVTAGNVFATQADLQAAISSSPAWYSVLVDTSIAPAVVTGNFDFQSGRWSSVPGLFTTVTFSNATSTNAAFATLDVWELNFVNDVASATVPYTGSCVFTVAFGAIRSSGAQPFCSGAAFLVFLLDRANLGDGAHAAVSGSAGGATIYAIGNTVQINAAAITGAAGHLFYSCGVVVVGGFPAGWTSTPNTYAGVLAYVPGVAANWNPVPTLAAPALDQLAAPNTQNALAAAQAAVAVGVATAPAITRQRAGVFSLFGSLSFTTSTGAAVTAQFFKDGVTFGPSGNGLTAVAATSYTLSFSWGDTAADAAAHVYSYRITPSAGTVTIAANAGGIFVLEA